MIKQIVNYIKEGINTKTTTVSKPFWHYVLGGLFLITLGIKLYANLEHQMDIQFADEAAYLRFGLDFPTTFNRNWGPLYCIWYKLLSFITTDAIKLYYLNYRIIGIALPIFVYIFLLRINASVLAALFLSFCLLVMNNSVVCWPRVSHFCLIIATIGLIGTTFTYNLLYKLFLFAVVCLLCSYARPEFYLSFLLLIIGILFYIVVDRNFISKRHIAVLILFIALATILHYIFRFPSNDFFGYKRSVAAFFQHYAFSYIYRGKAHADAWLIWEDLSKQQFGNCNSLFCIIKTNPTEFLMHIFTNIKITIVVLFTELPNYFFPLIALKYKKVKVVFVILSYLIIFFIFLNKSRRQYFLSLVKQHLFLLILIFCFVVPTYISTILYFPRMHYIYLQSLFYIIFIYFMLKSISNKKYLSIFQSVSIVFALIVLFTFGYAYNFLNINKTKGANNANQTLITFLDDLTNKKHTVFTNMPFLTGMLKGNYKEVNTVFDKKKAVPFTNYLNKHQIDVVIVSESLKRDPHLSSDSSWIDFYNNYKKYNFTSKFIADSTYQILYQSVP